MISTNDNIAEAKRQRRIAHQYMLPKKEQTHITEDDVSTPPALHITDEANNVWTLGYRYATPPNTPKGEFAFCVCRNGRETGEFASRIERKGGRIRIFTSQGFKTWNGRAFL